MRIAEGGRPPLAFFMSKGQYLSHHQQGIVKRFYDNQDTLVVQKLAELSSELYILQGDESGAKKAAAHWKSVAIAIKKTTIDPMRAARIVNERKVEDLAKVVQELSAPGAKVLPDKPRSFATSTPTSTAPSSVEPAVSSPAPARAIDPAAPPTPDVLKAAHAHKGASFVEIFQNCIVYNDDVFADFTDKSVAGARQLWLTAGEKMLFAGGAKGIALDTAALTLKVVEGDDPSVIVHDPCNRSVAHMLVEMPASGFPVALGVIYNDPAPTFDSAVIEQNAALAAGKSPNLQALVAEGQTWQVEKEPRAE